jgi:hypothetical protein
MDNSIVGRLFLFDVNAAEQTIEYLNKIGLGCDKYRKENIDYMRLRDMYIIEFKEKPFIFKTLEYNNLFGEENYTNIRCIGEHGISFYIAGPAFGDGSIFVPINNINCIHTVEKEQIDSQISFEKCNL